MSSLENEILASRLSRSEVLDHNGSSCCYACWLGGGCKNCRLKAAKKALLARRAEKPQEQKKSPARKQRKQRKFYKGGQFLPGGTRAPSGGCFK